jgi:transposase
LLPRWRANIFFFGAHLCGRLCKKRKERLNAHNDLRKRVIIKKYFQNQNYESIISDLSKFNVKQNFANQTVKRYIETGSSGRRKYSTRKRSVTGRVVVKTIRERITRKCDISARKLAAGLKLNRETVRLVLKNDLQLSTYKKTKIHGLTSEQWRSVSNVRKFC